MPDDCPRTPRTLLIPDHLWDALAAMSSEMGAERDALVNQALYTFARLNGFLVPSDLRRLAGDEARAPGHSTPRELSPVNGRENVEVDGSLLHEHAAGPTSMDLPNLGELWRNPRGRPPEPEATPSPPPGRVLVLVADGRELERVQKDRFVIGRGKHCDLIINSGKVSREHAAIVRSGADWFIEDLGSSNGTWFDKRRISRRQIQDGDEYYICAEKLGCVFR
ncbi:MAG: FHA domain-containing protein [Deltaproteobacteria bacterium]|nr:MAG: FHA domain-containing protein [Deltaproteobacteria bacterium]